MRSRVILLAVYLTCAGRQSVEADMIISKDTPASIVVGPGATETERFAAGELRRYLKEITGADLRIETESDVDPSGLILSIGNTKYSRGAEDRFDKAVAGPGSDSFIIKADGRLVLLVGGGDRGTLYSVYEFLERQGCRWFMPGKLGEVIPTEESLRVEDTDILRIPEFIQREIITEAPPGLTEEDLIDWAARNRINRMYGISYRNPAVYRKHGGHIRWQLLVHNFSFALPNAKYFAEHPEYYSLYKGDRVKVGNEEGSLCTTCPDVIRIFSEFASDWFDRNPDGAIVPVSPMDGMIKWCECPACRDLGGLNFAPGKRGSMSRRLVVFVNEIAKRVYARHPDRYLYLLAYQNYMDPVPDLTLEKNVVVAVAHHGCYAHGIGQCAANRDAAERLRQWAAMANPDSGSPGNFDYTLLHGYLPESALAPQPYARTIRDTIRLLHALGSRYYVVLCGPSLTHNPLPFYLVARLTWDPEADYDRLYDDFFDRFYQEAAGSMKAYWSLLEDAVQKADWHPINWRDTAVPSPRVYTPAVLADGESLLAEAERRAETDTVRRRIALVRQSFEYAKAQVAADDAGWKLTRGQDVYVINAEGTARDEERLAALMDEYQRTAAPDRALLQSIFRLRKRECPIVRLENERIRVAVIPGIGGRIIRLVDKATGVNFMREPWDVDRLDNIGMFYFHYGGYEEYAGGAFAAPGWEQEYAFSLSEDDRCRRIELSTDVPSFSLKRTLSLAKGNSPELKIESILTNTDTTRVTAQLRVHPMMRIGDDTDADYLYIRNAQGEFRRSHISAGLLEQPDGLWATIDEKANFGIANCFDPREVSCYVYYSPHERFFDMELIGHKRELGPGESLSIRHRYRVLDTAVDQINQLPQ